MAGLKHVEFEIYGKRRAIRDIRDYDGKSFFAYYKGHSIDVSKERNGVYVRCAHPDGGYIVDGYFDGSLSDGVRICLENIFYADAAATVADANQTEKQ